MEKVSSESERCLQELPHRQKHFGGQVGGQGSSGSPLARWCPKSAYVPVIRDEGQWIRDGSSWVLDPSGNHFQVCLQ